MIPRQEFLEDILFTFHKQKSQAEKAIEQIDSDVIFFRKPAEFSNSIAIIMKHVAGNLKSRWTDFLTTDGDKSWRDRDDEFLITENDTRESLMAYWQDGWQTLFRTLSQLTEADLTKIVTIREEPHKVYQAIHRSLSHIGYHVGQIVYLCRLLKTEDWKWLTIPPGQSDAFKSVGTYLKK